MSDDPSAKTEALEHEAPNTLEGWSVLHQVFRLRREALGALDAARRERILRQAAGAISAMERREDGESALFSILGHKGDLLAVHFRRSFDELERAQADVAALELNAFIEQSGSYVSMVEIGLYEATVALNARLMDEGLRPHSTRMETGGRRRTCRAARQDGHAPVAQDSRSPLPLFLPDEQTARRRRQLVPASDR